MNHFSKAVLFLALVYVGVGMIAFPGWYYGAFHFGGMSFLLYKAQTTYFAMNAAVSVLILLLGFTYVSLASRRVKVARSVSKFLASPACLGIIWAIVIIAGLRLMTAPTAWLHQDSPSEKEIRALLYPPPITAPIDFVFIEGQKISQVYDQLADNLRLTERQVRSELARSLEVGGEVRGVADVRGKVAHEGETTDTYAAGEMSAIRKAVDVINGLYQENDLLSVRPIEFQSDILRDFDAAVTLLADQHGLALPLPAVEARREQVMDESIGHDIAAGFEMNSWVLISGIFHVDVNNGTAEFSFDYVSTNPSRVVFRIIIPCEQLDPIQKARLAAEPLWQLNVFGMLINSRDTTLGITYEVKCYAIYR